MPCGFKGISFYYVARGGGLLEAVPDQQQEYFKTYAMRRGVQDTPHHGIKGVQPASKKNSYGHQSGRGEREKY